MTLQGFVASSLSFDRIYSSPLKRAIHTARIIAGNAPIIEDERLSEINFGPYEGTSISDGRFLDENIKACFKDPVNYRPPFGAESFQDAIKRMEEFLQNEIAPLYGKCQSVLCVSHGGIMQALRQIVLGLDIKDYWKYPQPNCAVHTIGFDGTRFHPVAMDEIFYGKSFAEGLPSF